MNKPNAYDEVKAGGQFEAPELGGHICKIKKVVESQSKSGMPMIIVYFDFANDDTQPDLFFREYENNTNDGRKWPFNGTSWIMVNDYQEANKTSRKFKSFCECFQRSNGVKVQWGVPDWGKQFAGKRIGAVYGNEEDEYNGQYRMRPRLKWFCDADKALSAKVPDAKYIQNKPVAAAGFTNVPMEDDDLPF